MAAPHYSTACISGLGGGETSEGSIPSAAALAQLIQLILEWPACYTMLYMDFFGAALRIESERSSFQAAAIHIQDLQAAQSAAENSWKFDGDATWDPVMIQ